MQLGMGGFPVRRHNLVPVSRASGAYDVHDFSPESSCARCGICRTSRRFCLDKVDPAPMGAGTIRTAHSCSYGKKIVNRHTRRMPGNWEPNCLPPNRESAHAQLHYEIPSYRRSTPAALRPPPPAARKVPAALPNVLRAFRSPVSLNVADYFGILRCNSHHHRSALDALVRRLSYAGHARPPASWRTC